MAFIDANKDRVTAGLRWGVEPICRVLQVAPSTYYDAKSRPPSKRSVTDAELKEEIRRVYKHNRSCYGAQKLWRQLQREGIACGRDRVARLMRTLGICGVTRGKERPKTTVPAAEGRPEDLVKRNFSAGAPNRLWVADITYVATVVGFVYTAFVIDVFSRAIVGWAVSKSLTATVALDALELAIWRRSGAVKGVVHHSDRGVQYLSIRYTERLEEAGAAPSVGSRATSYDNALAETVNGLYKTELIHRQASWAGAGQVECATAEWVAWWNEARLHSAIGYVAPAEYEAKAARAQTAQAPAA